MVCEGVGADVYSTRTATSQTRQNAPLLFPLCCCCCMVVACVQPGIIVKTLFLSFGFSCSSFPLKQFKKCTRPISSKMLLARLRLAPHTSGNRAASDASLNARAAEVVERLTLEYNRSQELSSKESVLSSAGLTNNTQNSRACLVNSFEVAQASLTKICNAPITNLTVAEGGARGPFPFIEAARSHLSHRSAVATTLHVPRRISDLDGFWPYLTHTVRSRFGGKDVDGLGDTDIVESFESWVEMYYPEREHKTFPFNVLMRLVETFGAYESNLFYRSMLGEHMQNGGKGGDAFIDGVVGSVRSFYGAAMPSYEELFLCKQLAEWASSYRHALATQHRNVIPFDSAIDLGCGSGVMTNLLLRTQFTNILATDDSVASVLCLQESVERNPRFKGKKILGRRLFTEVREGLLPAPEASNDAHSNREAAVRKATQQLLERHRGLAYERIVNDRRRSGRLKGGAVEVSSEEDALLGGEFDAHLEGSGGTSSLEEKALAANVFGGKQSGFDLAVFNAVAPPLFRNLPWFPDHAHAFRGSDPMVLRQIINSLNNVTGGAEPLLNRDHGHFAIFYSNAHDLLHSGPHAKGALDEMLNLSSGETNRVGAVLGWEVVKRTQASLAYSCRSIIPNPQNLNSSPILRLVVDSSAKSSLGAEIADYHRSLSHELLVVKPIYSKLWQGMTVEQRAEMAATSELQRRHAVNIFKSNELMDFEDTYEYDHYLPRDGSGNPFSVEARNATFSYLADEYFDHEGVRGSMEVAADVEVGSGDDRRKGSLLYNRNDPSYATTGYVPGQKREGTSIANNQAVTSGGSTLVFDAIFNRDARRLRQRKYGKLAVQSRATKEAYINRVAGSNAAKLQILNELDRSDFDKQPR